MNISRDGAGRNSITKAARSLWLAGLLMLASVFEMVDARADLFVGTFRSPTDLNVLRYDGTTGAFKGVFGPRERRPYFSVRRRVRTGRQSLCEQFRW
jgi:hypothetical protein